ncbi:MAG TPA: efflux RND transporter periplasmic adaptor subunit [Candidatus Polarisedimenticolia bacterium]|nr:efflux RND transporter periplasmic adaptor subunit [Candidatus Polarisedimenticolia bacterium]
MNPPRGVGRMVSSVLALALVASPVACSRRGPAGAAAPRVPSIAVRTARVTTGGASWIEVPGTVEAAQAADLASRVAAVVESVHVEEGSRVRAGELLIALDGRDLRARLQAAEAVLKAATAQHERAAALFARDAATRQELEAAEAARAAAQAERDSAAAQAGYVEIRAPFDGVVTGKWSHAGDLAAPGRPLLSMQGAGLLRVAASLTRAQAERLTLAQSLEAVLEGGEVVVCRVSALAPAGDPSSLRSLVKADLPKGAAARAGSFARLRLPRGDEEPVPMVPKAALVEKGALTAVFVVEAGRARLRFISPGDSAGDRVVVRAGLDAGEEVVLDPGLLADGAMVEANP